MTTDAASIASHADTTPQAAWRAASKSSVLGKRQAWANAASSSTLSLASNENSCEPDDISIFSETILSNAWLAAFPGAAFGATSSPRWSQCRTDSGNIGDVWHRAEDDDAQRGALGSSGFMPIHPAPRKGSSSSLASACSIRSTTADRSNVASEAALTVGWEASLAEVVAVQASDTILAGVQARDNDDSEERAALPEEASTNSLFEKVAPELAGLRDHAGLDQESISDGDLRDVLVCDDGSPLHTSIDGTVDGHAQAAASALQCGSVVTEFLVVDHDDGESAAEYGSSQALDDCDGAALLEQGESCIGNSTQARLNDEEIGADYVHHRALEGLELAQCRLSSRNGSASSLNSSCSMRSTTVDRSNGGSKATVIAGWEADLAGVVTLQATDTALAGAAEHEDDLEDQLLEEAPTSSIFREIPPELSAMRHLPSLEQDALGDGSRSHSVMSGVGEPDAQIAAAASHVDTVATDGLRVDGKTSTCTDVGHAQDAAAAMQSMVAATLLVVGETGIDAVDGDAQHAAPTMQCDTEGTEARQSSSATDGLLVVGEHVLGTADADSQTAASNAQCDGMVTEHLLATHARVMGAVTLDVPASDLQCDGTVEDLLVDGEHVASSKAPQRGELAPVDKSTAWHEETPRGTALCSCFEGVKDEAPVGVDTGRGQVQAPGASGLENATGFSSQLAAAIAARDARIASLRAELDDIRGTLKWREAYIHHLETERASAHAAIQNADDAMAACSVAGAEAEQCTQQLEAKQTRLLHKLQGKARLKRVLDGPTSEKSLGRAPTSLHSTTWQWGPSPRSGSRSREVVYRGHRPWSASVGGYREAARVR